VFPDTSGEPKAWLGVVPFRMEGVRASWAPPLPGLSAFPELNVRTYVHVDGTQPAVWFFSLDAASRVACWSARTFWALPYHFARMHSVRDGNRLRYASRRRRGEAACTAEFEIGADLGTAAPRSLEWFLVERYLLLAQDRRGRLCGGQVHHVPYPLRAARLLEWTDGMASANGFEVGAPDHVVWSEGVDTRVFALRPLE
jgi:uncharacterized protein YqjF (DUF2071 family)